MLTYRRPWSCPSRRKLATWVFYQRSVRRGKNKTRTCVLKRARAARLEKLPGWAWDGTRATEVTGDDEEEKEEEESEDDDAGAFLAITDGGEGVASREMHEGIHGKMSSGERAEDGRGDTVLEVSWEELQPPYPCVLFCVNSRNITVNITHKRTRAHILLKCTCTISVQQSRQHLIILVPG